MLSTQIILVAIGLAITVICIADALINGKTPNLKD